MLYFSYELSTQPMDHSDPKTFKTTYQPQEQKQLKFFPQSIIFCFQFVCLFFFNTQPPLLIKLIFFHQIKITRSISGNKTQVAYVLLTESFSIKRAATKATKIEHLVIFEKYLDSYHLHPIASSEYIHTNKAKQYRVI